MLETLRIIITLHMTYKVNTTLFAIKQMPIIKKAVGDGVYSIKGFKIIATVLFILKEFLMKIPMKFLYAFIMMGAPVLLYKESAQPAFLLHAFVFTTLLGGFIQPFMLVPEEYARYAVQQLRINAKRFTLTEFFYSLLTGVAGWILVAAVAVSIYNLPKIAVLLVPGFYVAVKIISGSLTLIRMEKYRVTGKRIKSVVTISALVLLLAAAYLPTGIAAIKAEAGLDIPHSIVESGENSSSSTEGSNHESVIGDVGEEEDSEELPLLDAPKLPIAASMGIMGAGIIVAIPCLYYILWGYKAYKAAFSAKLAEQMEMILAIKDTTEGYGRRTIANDLDITSNKSGFEYMNELFIKRHKKLLWKASTKITLVIVTFLVGLVVATRIYPSINDDVNGFTMRVLPSSTFLMYMINRGQGFTRALFMNCDRSLLTYSFFKERGNLLELFKIRLIEISKVNLLPAGILGLGAAALLFITGGTDTPVNYAILIAVLPAMAVFFSVHYLVMYYLLQPYNTEAQVKSTTYQIVMALTYIIPYNLMRIPMETLVFGVAVISFSGIYCVIACILAYRLAPKTFRLR